MTIQDSHIRQRALDPTQSFIVQAPAGSGKTELLTQRYLILLAHAEKAPEEIIAITFTRKAAAEMRARILHALAFAQENEPDKNDYRHTTWTFAQAVLKKDHALHWQLMQNPNRLRILTIDALSAFLCRQTPMLTNFGGSPTVCENAKPLYQLAAQRVLMNPEASLEHLLLHLDNNVNKVENLLANLLNHRDQWLSHILYCYKNNHLLRESLENSLKRVVIEKMQMAAETLPHQLRQTLVLLARHAGNYFVENKIGNSVSHCATWIWELKPSLDKFSSWYGLANLLLTQAGSFRKTVNVNNGFPPKDSNKSLMLAVLTELDDHPDFKECLHDIFMAPPTTYTNLQWETLTALTTLLPLLAAQLTLVFQEKGEVDFTELNLSALKALGTDEFPTDLALYLDYQIRHLLIDEFQDTSVVHLHLLEKITKEWESDDGRTLFVVGDPMQSIYRFRNAEVGLFLRAQAQGIGNISLEPLTLTMNFRSQENLVTWFNDTFSAVFPAASDIATGRVPYTKAIAAKNPVNDFNVAFYPLIPGDENSEAQLLAEKIKRIHTENASDSIAILVRSRAQLIAIIPYLQEHNLPYQAIDIEPLAKRAEIQDLLSLTRALLHRADRIAWLAILRAPFCGCTLTDLEAIAQFAEKITIWEAIENTEKITTLSSDGLRRIKRLYKQLEIAFHTQYQLPLSQWIENIWMILKGPACLSNSTDLNYTRAYFNLIEKMETHANALLMDQLIENCEALFANSPQTMTPAIQIMTIHKSKGLEFDHVFIPGLQRQTPGDREKLLRWYDRPNALGGDDLILAPIKSISHKSDAIYDYLKTVEQQKQAHEIVRLLYVAATRAKKSLHLFAQIEWDDKKLALKPPKKGSFLDELWPLYESIAVQHTPNLFQTNALLSQARAPLLFSRLQLDDSIQDTVMLTAEKPIKIDITLHSQASQIVGTVIHEVFQTIVEMGVEHWKRQADFPFAQWRSRLFSHGLLPHELDAAIECISTAVSKTVSCERGQWILSNHHKESYCEWALTHYHSSDIQHRVIDRSFVDEDNIRWIIDYKTALPKSDESQQDFLDRQKKQYQSQLESYAETSADAKKTENRPIKMGLYFPLCQGWVAWEHV